MNETGRRDVPLFRGGSRDGVEEVVSFFGHFDLYLKFVSFVFQNLLGSLLPETRPPRPSDVCLIPWYLQSYVGKREDANKKKLGLNAHHLFQITQNTQRQLHVEVSEVHFHIHGYILAF